MTAKKCGTWLGDKRSGTLFAEFAALRELHCVENMAIIVSASALVKSLSSLKLLVMIAFAMLLASCGNNSEIADDLNEYKQRLESFTELEALPAADVVDLQAPSKSSLKLEIPEISINLREFYAFNDCALSQLVAERNTSLGKLQLPSSRYLYELSLLKELKRCEQQLVTQKEKSELVHKLRDWHTQKSQLLPLAWGNLFTQSDESYVFFAAHTGYISGDSNDNFNASKLAFAYIVALANNADNLSLEEQNANSPNAKLLENHLKELEKSRLLAKMWRTQLLLIEQLDAISPMLEEYARINTCVNITQKDDIDIMQNIFRIFFAEKIQPAAAELNKYYYQLTPIISKLLENEVLPTELIQYIALHTNEKHQQYRASMQKHIRLWQVIFARCEEFQK